ncbi:MAG TPA: zinc ribbon domain-containing protein [Methanocorpusculum sp.]|nr:zinc ribbon domain-containing protein [Methanocorpusculum sp.]
MAGLKTTSVQLTFRMSGDFYEEMNKISEEQGVKTTDFARNAIHAFVYGTRCPICGAQMTEGARFCSACGTPLHDETVHRRAADENARFVQFHALMSRPEMVFAGKSKEELESYDRALKLALKQAKDGGK